MWSAEGGKKNRCEPKGERKISFGGKKRLTVTLTLMTVVFHVHVLLLPRQTPLECAGKKERKKELDCQNEAKRKKPFKRIR